MTAAINKDSLVVERKGKWIVKDSRTGKVIVRAMNLPSLQSWMEKHDIESIPRSDQ